MPGVIHVSATQDVSYAEVAQHIAFKLGADEMLVQPVSCRKVGQTFAPEYTTLDTSRLSEIGKLAQGPWEAINQTFNLGYQ